MTHIYIKLAKQLLFIVNNWENQKYSGQPWLVLSISNKMKWSGTVWLVRERWRGAPSLFPGPGWGLDMLGRSWAQWRPDSITAKPQLPSGSEYWTQQALCSSVNVDVGNNLSDSLLTSY